MPKKISKNEDELITQKYLDEVLDIRFAEQDRKIDQKFVEQEKRFFQKMNEKFDEQTNHLIGAFENVVDQLRGGLSDDNVDIKNRVAVLETKVMVLENKN